MSDLRTLFPAGCVPVSTTESHWPIERLDDALEEIPEGLIVGHLVRRRRWRHEAAGTLRRSWEVA
jgi:hypothetical protein